MAPITRFYLYMVDAYYGNCAAEDDLEGQKAEAGPPLCVSARSEICFLTSLHCFCCPSPQTFLCCSTTRQLPCTAVIFRSCFNWRKTWNVLLVNVFAIRTLFTHPAELEICICMCLGSCFWLHDWWKWWGLGSIVQCGRPSSHEISMSNEVD